MTLAKFLVFAPPAATAYLAEGNGTIAIAVRRFIADRSN
jgi:hypothetical protein